MDHSGAHVGSGEGCECVGAGVIWELSVLSTQLCCEPKTALKMIYLKERGGRAQWLTPVIPVLWEVKVGGSLEPKSSRPAWATWQTPSLSKIQN